MCLIFQEFGLHRQDLLQAPLAHFIARRVDGRLTDAERCCAGLSSAVFRMMSGGSPAIFDAKSRLWREQVATGQYSPGAFVMGVTMLCKSI